MLMKHSPQLILINKEQKSCFTSSLFYYGRKRKLIWFGSIINFIKIQVSLCSGCSSLATYLKLWILFLTERCCIARTLNTVHNDGSKLYLSLASPLRSYGKLFLYVPINFINVFIIAEKSTSILFLRFSRVCLFDRLLVPWKILSNYVSLLRLRILLHSLLNVTEIILQSRHSHQMSWVVVLLAWENRL